MPNEGGSHNHRKATTATHRSYGGLVKATQIRDKSERTDSFLLQAELLDGATGNSLECELDAEIFVDLFRRIVINVEEVL